MEQSKIVVKVVVGDGDIPLEDQPKQIVDFSSAPLTRKKEVKKSVKLNACSQNRKEKHNI